MRKLRLGLIALSAITGIGSAFAFNSKAKHVNPTYFAVEDESGYHWVSSRPGTGFSCANSNTAACTVTSPDDLTDPMYNNELPASATIQGDSEDKIWKAN